MYESESIVCPDFIILSSFVFIVGAQASGMKVLYSHTKTPGSTCKSLRHIPQAPDRILDAPDIMDDYCELF